MTIVSMQGRLPQELKYNTIVNWHFLGMFKDDIIILRYSVHKLRDYHYHRAKLILSSGMYYSLVT